MEVQPLAALARELELSGVAAGVGGLSVSEAVG